MKKADKDRMNKRYDRRLEKWGYDIRSLASGDETRRKLRFDILTEVGLESGCRVLDLGCGFGDLYGYLTEQNIQVEYVGYDLNPNLIKIAKEQYPAAEFQVKDIQSEPFPRFDYIVSSSAFNLRLLEDDNYAFAGDMLNRCYDHADRGVAIDFLTSYVDYESPEAFHYQPEKMFAIAKNITKRVCLRHDYRLYEFCLYLYPDFTGWRKHDDPV